MKFFIVFCSLISVVFGDVSELECIESHLTETIVDLEEDDRTICNEIIENRTGSFNQIYLNDVLKSKIVCVFHAQEEFKLTDLYLKGVALHLKSKTDEDEFMKSFNETMKFLRQLISITCDSYDVFVKVFERQHQPNKTLNHDDLCIKKYFLDHKIINASEFDIDPTSINVTDCEEVFGGLETKVNEFYELNNFFGLSLDKANKCMKKNFNAVHLKWASFDIIGSFEMTDEKLEEVKSRYVKAVKNTFELYLKCLRELF